MQTVLVVEDSAVVTKVLRHLLSRNSDLNPVYATSMAEVKSLFDNNDYTFFAALVDLSLPDAPNGQVVDFVLEQHIPTIVLTATFDEQKREALLSKGIVDYVTKDGRFSYEYAVGVLGRLIKNQSIKILVVEDSATQRRFIASLLSLHLYQVLEAADGREAIKVLLANPETRLLITDYHMPVMDGFELVKTIRSKYEKTDLVVIGLSSDSGEGSLSARFIKNGANDFLRKPFNHEEFFCRITHNIEFVEMVDRVRDAAHRDDLTGCYNRRYFFEKASEIYQRNSITKSPLSLVVLTLDNFRSINERFGYEVGNGVMQHAADCLNSAFNRFLLAGSGGEEFFVLLPGLGNDKAVAFVEEVRQLLAGNPFYTDEARVDLSFSAGVTSVTGDSIDDMLGYAEQCLHRAREAGGDLVFGDD